MPTYAAGVSTRRSAAVLGALVSLTIAACSAPPVAVPTTAPTPASASPSPTATPTATPSPTPTPTPTPAYLSPLTGLPADGPAPVLVVKLDNTRSAQPHAGLAKADVVYVEEVEYGITRLAAVFSTAVPDRIGPVRSARITDIDLLAQYGKPAFAYSGAQRKMFPVLDDADFIDVSPRTGGEGYSRDASRFAPYNYYVDGDVALERAPRASLAPDLGFVFDSEVPAGGLVATSAAMEWGYSSARFDFRRRTGEYAVSMNGERARSEGSTDGQNASTVVIQYVTQEPSAYFDKGGGNTPHAETIGTGRAVVLRDGLAWRTRWSRPSSDVGTTFTMADGTPMAFKPGQVWVVLLDRDRKTTVKPLTEPPPSRLAASPPGIPTPSPAATASAT